MIHRTCVRRDRISMLASERVLIISLSLLMTGLVHAADEAENKAERVCRLQPQEGGMSFELELVCTSSDDQTNDEGDVSDETANSPETDSSEVDQVIDRLAVEGSAVQVDSSTAEPSKDTEIFKIDRETAEPAEEESSAAERDLFGLGYSYHKTSDHYHANTSSFSYRNNRREWFWPWQESTDHGLDWGLDVDRTKGDIKDIAFNAVRVEGMLGGYLTRGTYLQAQLGRHVLRTDQGDRTVTPRHLTAMFGLKQDFSVQLETSRDFIYTGGSVTGGITKQLTALDHTASFRWLPDPSLRVQGQGAYRKYDQTNDENIARQVDLSALYGISPGWPWVWGGVGAQQLRYDREVPDYWSPNRFTAYGLRFESSFPLFKRLSGSAAANLNRQEENGTHGTGYDINAGLQYRLYGQLYARIDLSKSKSLQQHSTWKSDNVFFTLSGPLF